MSAADSGSGVVTSEVDALGRLRGVLDQLPAAVAILRGPDHVFEFTNETYRQLVSDRPVEGLPAEVALPEVREQGFIDLLDRVFHTGERYVGRETRVALLREDGIEELFVDFIYQPIRDASNAVEGILAHAVDVTEAVRARNELADALRREQEDRFRHAVESMLDTVMMAAPISDQDRIVDFEVSFVNAANEALGRRERAELLGRRFTELWPNVAATGLLGHYVAVVESGEPLVLDEYAYTDVVDGEQVSAIFDIRATRLGRDLFLAFRDVTERVARERALRESRARLAREHEAVSALQDAILPRHIPTVPGTDIAAAYIAASQDVEVGGDWFDVFTLPDGTVGVAVGDVAGKGIDAAGAMAQIRTAGRVAALTGSSPTEVLRTQNAIMISSGLGPFATTMFARYDPVTGSLTWASAGHLPPLLVTAAASRMLPTPAGPPLGIVDDPDYASTEVVLGPGERLIVYTDGLVERRDEAITDGVERLRSVAVLAGTAREACHHLLELLDVADGRGDDVCVVTLDRHRV